MLSHILHIAITHLTLMLQLSWTALRPLHAILLDAALLCSLNSPSLHQWRGAVKKAAAKKPAAGKGKGKQAPAKKSKERMQSKPLDEKDPLTQKTIAMLVAGPPPEVAVQQRTHQQQHELVARAKAYSRRRMLEHRAWQRDLAVKLQLKRAAVQALPLALRGAAMQEDLTPFPLTRHYLYDQPPDAYRD